ncbi:hypothetical protein P186_1600 [Pyrobaculum ferrireducens]|uniref:Uncharacterized protein n=1 Tax=Pyrobaculum ferrireducens TaxID=1104324 RepID=G7VG20_9CREN|nr:hypothetical protein P186_1600 [Pyrobaculum ferrireducens]
MPYSEATTLIIVWTLAAAAFVMPFGRLAEVLGYAESLKRG